MSENSELIINENKFQGGSQHDEDVTLLAKIVDAPATLLLSNRLISVGYGMKSPIYRGIV